MSAAAALAVDTGASATMQQAAQAVDPETGEILEAGAKVPEQKQATDTPEQMRERLGFIEQQAREWRMGSAHDPKSATACKPSSPRSSRLPTNPVLLPKWSSPHRQSTFRGGAPTNSSAFWRRLAVTAGARRPWPRSTPSDAAASRSSRVRCRAGHASRCPAASAGRAAIKDVLAKQIPDMTDGELQQAIDHYGPSNKRTVKLLKEVQKRGQGAPAAAVQPTQAPMAPEQSRPAPSPRSESAQPSEAADPAEEVRRQLREVETKILAVAPSAMGAGGGDIEAAMKSRKVPVTLKAQRKRLKEQLRQASQGEQAQNVQPAQMDAASGQGSGAVPAGSAGWHQVTCRHRPSGSTCRSTCTRQQSACSCGNGRRSTACRRRRRHRYSSPCRSARRTARSPDRQCAPD